MPERKTWGIHAGRTGDAESLFLNDSCVALGWPQVGDLSGLADREAFKAAVAKRFPNAKPAVIPNTAGQLFRFVHEMKQGDLVVYPSKASRKVHIGYVSGSYRYRPDAPAYPNTRPVDWKTAVPRTSFSQGALYEIGSALSFFQVRNYADEFFQAVSGTPTPAPPADDESVGLVAEDIEETTRDFVLKQLATELKGHPLAEFVAQLLGAMGFHVRVSPEGPDGGVDIIAHKDELGFEPPIVKVQVKSTEGSVGDPIVSALYGKVTAHEYGLLVTLGSFTSQAETFARSKSNLRLIDGDGLVGLIFRHYDQLDAKYKALLPLKRVFVPQPLEDETGS